VYLQVLSPEALQLSLTSNKEQPMKFRKKPIVIEACVWEGKNLESIKAVMGEDFPGRPLGLALVVPTLEGDVCADPGDWIIKGVKGEFYPCKPDIFVMTYDPA
jgi:hypothetical protein